MNGRPTFAQVGVVSLVTVALAERKFGTWFRVCVHAPVNTCRAQCLSTSVVQASMGWVVRARTRRHTQAHTHTHTHAHTHTHTHTHAHTQTHTHTQRTHTHAHAHAHTHTHTHKQDSLCSRKHLYCVHFDP